MIRGKFSQDADPRTGGRKKDKEFIDSENHTETNAHCSGKQHDHVDETGNPHEEETRMVNDKFRFDKEMTNVKWHRSYRDDYAPQEPEVSKTQLFVRHLPADMDENGVRNMFGKFGPIE
ncbi:hypothetical protein FOZ63_006785, partial [Perkinsus olseni]